MTEASAFAAARRSFRPARAPPPSCSASAASISGWTCQAKRCACTASRSKPSARTGSSGSAQKAWARPSRFSVDSSAAKTSSIRSKCVSLDCSSSSS